MISMESAVSLEQIHELTGPMVHGDEREFSAALLSVHADELLMQQILPRAGITGDQYYRALESSARTLGYIIDPRTGLRFETSVANDHAVDTSYDAEISTYGSAITNNKGNAVEFAENAALNPDKRRLYIASFGNGYSSPLSKKEAKYFTKTGLLTEEVWDGDKKVVQALPTIQALARALVAADMCIDRLSGNSAGGSILTALMVAMNEGQVTHAFVKGRPNLVSHAPLLLGGKLFVGEHIKAANANRARTRDSWALTQQMVQDAEALFERRAPELEEDLIAGTIANGIRKAADGRAYSRGERRDGSSPAITDTTRAAQRHPDARFTFHFSAEDMLYHRQYSTLARFVLATNGQIPNPGAVEALIIPGTHADHTYFPSLRWASETYAFNKK